MREVLENAERIAEASSKASAASQQAAKSSENQSEAASAMAAAVEEMTVSITHINDSMHETLARARDAGIAASDGAQIIAQTHVEMDKIVATVGDASTAIDTLSSESSNISKILQVIKEVADQTNLLALNAAIEAARAGEQGRGFAVVADEVRKLSERTAVSTGEISQMVAAIQHSTRDVVAEVGRGVALVDEGVDSARMSGEAIAKLREMAQEVARIVASVNDTLREQSAASTDVAQKIESVAAQAEESSSIAQKTSQAAASMAETATGMQNLVARFRI